MAFHELSDSEATAEQEAIATAALDKARVTATQRLLASPAGGGVVSDASEAAAVLAARNADDPRYEHLSYFEKPWALLVLRLVAGVLTDPSPAVRDARERGAAVADIAAALGITENGVYKRYGHSVVLRPRKTRSESD